jgi:hypothetical protein
MILPAIAAHAQCAGNPNVRSAQHKREPVTTETRHTRGLGALRPEGFVKLPLDMDDPTGKTQPHVCKENTPEAPWVVWNIKIYIILLGA